MQRNVRGKLVESKGKLRMEIPEMAEPTPLISMLDSISSLRMATAGTSEPTAEQLLRDYDSLGGLSRGTCACCVRRAEEHMGAPARRLCVSIYGVCPSLDSVARGRVNTIVPAAQRHARQRSAAHFAHGGPGVGKDTKKGLHVQSHKQVCARCASAGIRHSFCPCRAGLGCLSTGDVCAFACRLGSRGDYLSSEESEGTVHEDVDSPSTRRSPAGKRTSRLQLVTPDPVPGKRSVACGGTPNEALSAIAAAKEGYPNLMTENREKARKRMQEVDTRKAAKERTRVTKVKLSDTGLFEEAFELAESLLRSAEKYSNRIESSLYGGSNGLTFPCVHKDRDDAVEPLPPANVHESGKSKWEEASKARAVGVVAMEQLLGRLQKANTERNVLDKKCTQLEEELKHLQEAHSVLLGNQNNFDAEMEAMEKRARLAEKTYAKREKKTLLEISRLQKSLADLHAKCGLLTDEKE